MSAEMFDFTVVMAVALCTGAGLLMAARFAVWIAVHWLGAPEWWLDEWK